MVLLWFLRVCVVWAYLELEILLPQPSQVFHLIHPLVCSTESSAYWKHWRQCDYVHSCWTTLIRGESDRSFFSFCVTARLSWLPRSIPSRCQGTCDSCLCVCLLLCFVFVLWTVEYLSGIHVVQDNQRKGVTPELVKALWQQRGTVLKSWTSNTVQKHTYDGYAKVVLWAEVPHTKAPWTNTFSEGKHHTPAASVLTMHCLQGSAGVPG